MTHLAPYAALSPEAKRQLADLEESRRAFAADRHYEIAATRVFAADYVIRAVTGEVLADDDVKLCMELALEEVG